MNNIEYLIQEEYNHKKYGFRVVTTSGRCLAHFIHKNDAIKFCETIDGVTEWVNKNFPNIPNQLWEQRQS